MHTRPDRLDGIARTGTAARARGQWMCRRSVASPEREHKARRRSRHLLIAPAMAIAGLIALAPDASTANASVRAAAAPAPTLAWDPCTGDLKGPGLECATARVPRSYRHPRGAKIKLFVMRHRASDRKERLGTLFTNPGGPAAPSPGLAHVIERFPEPVRQHFDIVVWDPRGLGRSAGVQCFDSMEDEKRFFGDVPIGINPSFPVGRGETDAWIERYRRFGMRCGKRNGSFLKRLSTANSARDLDLLRRAVGERKLTYFGESYGTFLGATYANLFPDRVRAMALDGNVDPRAWTHKQKKANSGKFLGTFLRLRADEGSAATLDAFLGLCGETDTQHCAFSAGSPEATREKYAALLERLRTNPESTDVSYADLAAETNGGLYEYPAWPALAKMLQDVWTTGTSKRALQSPSLRGPAVVPAASAGAPEAQRQYFGPEQTFAVVCSETPNPGPTAFRVLDGFAFERSGPIGQVWSWGTEVCSTWPATAADAYTGPWNARTANPVLVVGMTLDPATNYRGSVVMNRLLPRSRLLTVDGYGHGTFSNPSACANRYISRYLIRKRLPPKGARCKQGVGPFEGNP
jgi:pimeloyl-ACP methyl ester carboxylesterase